MKYKALLFVLLSLLMTSCTEGFENMFNFEDGKVTGNDTPPAGALPSEEFTLGNAKDEQYAEDVIKVVAKETTSNFYSLELMADGYYLFYESRPSDSYRAVRTRTRADENGTLTNQDGSQYGKFEKVGDKEYLLSNGMTVNLKDATGTNQRIQFVDDIGRTSNVYVNTESPVNIGDGTKSLCRTWNLNSYEMWAYFNGFYIFRLKQSIVDGELSTYFKVLGEDMIEHEFEENDYIEDETKMPEKVVFSSSNTYICFYMDGTSLFSKWEWVDEEQGIFRYVHEEYEDMDAIGDGRVTVRFAGNQMRIYEDYTETDDEDYDYGDDYYDDDEEDEDEVRLVIVNTLTAAN